MYKLVWPLPQESPEAQENLRRLETNISHAIYLFISRSGVPSLFKRLHKHESASPLAQHLSRFSLEQEVRSYLYSSLEDLLVVRLLRGVTASPLRGHLAEARRRVDQRTKSVPFHAVYLHPLRSASQPEAGSCVTIHCSLLGSLFSIRPPFMIRPS